MARLEDLLPKDTEAEWSCGHVGGAVCKECYRILAHRANILASDLSEAQDKIQELENTLARLRHGV